MSYYEQNTVAIYERKFELDFLCKIYQEGRLHFPHSEQLYDNSITAAGLIRAIQIGIPMPVIYASELQNGDFLILEFKNRLFSLLEYLYNSFPVNLEEIFPLPGYVFFSELRQQNTWLTGMILRTVFQFQIIDYHTPKYLHMETGLFHEKWNPAQEQIVRNILYTGHGIEDFHAVYSGILQLTPIFFQSGNFLKEYDILYILLFWGIYCNKFPLNQQTSNLCEQQLLEITTQNLYNWHYEWSDFINIWSSFISCPAAQFICTTGIDLGYNSFTENEKFKAKTFGLSLCLYDMAIKKRKEPSASLHLFLNDNYYTAQVDALRISSDNINSYLHSLWEDNRL